MTTQATTTDLERDERRLQARLDANLAAADRALKEATKQPTVKGSRGQSRPHPSFAIAARCDELALRLSQELRELRQRRDLDAKIERSRELTTDKPRLR